MDGATEKEACNPAMDWCRANNIPHILQGGNTPYYTYAIAEDYAASQVASLTSDLRTLAEALKGAVSVSREALCSWDADEEMRVGKLLKAMSGQLGGYRADTDAIHAALSLPSVRLLVRE